MTDDLIARLRLAAKILRDVGGQHGLGETVSEAAAALEAAREDAAHFRWLADYPNVYTVADLLRAGQYLTLRRACESLRPIDDARKEARND